MKRRRWYARNRSSPITRRAHRSYGSDTVTLWKSANTPHATMTFTASTAPWYTRRKHQPPIGITQPTWRSDPTGRRNGTGEGINPRRSNRSGVHIGPRPIFPPAAKVTTFVLLCGHRESPRERAGGGCDDHRRNPGIEGPAEQLHRNRPGWGRGRRDGARAGGSDSRSGNEGTDCPQAAFGRRRGPDARGETERGARSEDQRETSCGYGPREPPVILFLDTSALVKLY